VSGTILNPTRRFADYPGSYRVSCPRPNGAAASCLPPDSNDSARKHSTAARPKHTYLIAVSYLAPDEQKTGLAADDRPSRVPYVSTRSPPACVPLGGRGPRAKTMGHRHNLEMIVLPMRRLRAPPPDLAAPRWAWTCRGGFQGAGWLSS